MTIFKDLQKVSAKILGQFNEGEIKLIQLTLGSGSPDNPGTPTETSYDLKGTAKGVSFKYLKNNFIVATDLEVTCAVIEDVTPTLNDFIEIDGKRHKIISDLSIPPAGDRVVWKFIVRSGG